MNPIRIRHITTGLIIAFLLFLVIANQDNYQSEYPQTRTFPQSQTSYQSFDSYESLSNYCHYSSTNSNRHEILNKKMKGYREQTYWGSEHPIQERTRYMESDEFDRFLREEIEEKDANVYWGAEY